MFLPFSLGEDSFEEDHTGVRPVHHILDLRRFDPAAPAPLNE